MKRLIGPLLLLAGASSLEGCFTLVGLALSREEFQARKSVFKVSDTRTFDPTYHSFVGARLGCHALRNLEGFWELCRAPSMFVAFLASLLADAAILPYAVPRDLLLEPRTEAGDAAKE